MTAMYSPLRSSTSRRHATRQRGASLITVMLILVVVSALGIGAIHISMMGERSARNDRDMQVAWQAAESALMDAQFDIMGPMNSSRRTNGVFGTNNSQPNLTYFPSSGCGNSGDSIGLCATTSEAQAAANVKPVWLIADFTVHNNAAETTAYGAYTGQQYPTGSGVQSAQAPRYIIEPLRDYGVSIDKTTPTNATYVYRITAMGFGPREDIRAVAQMLLRP